MFLNSIIVEELLDSSSNTGIVGSEMKKVQCIINPMSTLLEKFSFIRTLCSSSVVVDRNLYKYYYSM